MCRRVMAAHQGGTRTKYYRQARRRPAHRAATGTLMSCADAERATRNTSKGLRPSTGARLGAALPRCPSSKTTAARGCARTPPAARAAAHAPHRASRAAMQLRYRAQGGLKSGAAQVRYSCSPPLEPSTHVAQACRRMRSIGRHEPPACDARAC